MSFAQISSALLLIMGFMSVTVNADPSPQSPSQPDMATPEFFMQNQPWYNGRIMMYLNPSAVDPRTIQSITTTTSTIVTEVSVPYSTTTVTSAFGDWRWTNNVSGNFDTRVASETTDILRAIGQEFMGPEYLASYGPGDARSYWFAEGLPSGMGDLYRAYNDCYVNTGGQCVGLHIDSGTYWTGTSTTQGPTTTATSNLPDFIEPDGTRVHSREVTVVTYDQTENRWRRQVIRVVDVNENGRIDGGDLVTEGYGGQERQGQIVSTTEEGVRTQTETTTVEETTVTTKKENRWKYSLAPLIFFDIQNQTKRVALDPMVFEQRARSGLSEIPTLEFASPSAPRWVSLREMGMLGVGGSVLAQHSSHPNAAVMLGLAPLMGAEKIYETVAPSRDGALSVTMPESPRHFHDLANLKVGDRLVFGQDGGVLFLAGVAHGLAYAGASHFAIGRWRTEVVRTGEDAFLVQRSQIDLSNYGLAVGGFVVAALSVSDFDSKSLSQSYMVKTSYPGAREALDKFLFEGDQTILQVEAQRRKEIEPVQTVSDHGRGRLRSISLGVPPFVVGSVGWGDIHGLKETTEEKSGEKTTAHYGVYLKAKDRRFFNWTDNVTTGFTGTLIEGKAGAQAFGEFAFSSSDTGSSASDLQAAIYELISMTALEGELSVKIPSSDKLSSARIGYGEVQFLLRFDDEATRFLRLLGQNPKGIAKIKQDIFAFAAMYIKINDIDGYGVGKDPLGLCHSHNVFPDQYPSTCSEHILSRAKYSADEVGKALAQMARNHGKKDKFSLSYAALGRAMMKSPFAFQTVTLSAVSGTAGRGVAGVYRVRADGLKSYEANVIWNN